MRTSTQYRVSAAALSSVLIAFSVIWFASACVFQVTNRDSKDGFSSAPLWTMLLLVLIPLSVLIVGPWLLKARRVDGQRLRWIDYCSLVFGFAPVAIWVALVIYVLVAGNSGIPRLN